MSSRIVLAAECDLRRDLVASLVLVGCVGLGAKVAVLGSADLR